MGWAEIIDDQYKRMAEADAAFVEEMKKDGHEDVWEVAQAYFNVHLRELNLKRTYLRDHRYKMQAKYLKEALLSIENYNTVKALLRK